MKKRVLSLLLACALLLPMCGGAVLADDPVKLVFWHSMGGVNGEAIDSLVKQFNEAYAGKIEVDVQFQGTYDDAINKLKSAGMGNLGCDVVQIYDIGTRFMIDSGWVVPMQELVDNDQYDSSKIEPNIAAYYTVDGKLYSMPFNSSTPLLYYNKDMFREAGLDPEAPPANFDELLEACAKLQKKDENGKIVVDALAISNYGWFFEQWLGKQGKHYVDNGNGREARATKVVYDENGGALAILETWKKLADSGLVAYMGRGSEGNNNAKAAFMAGQAAIIMESTAILKTALVNIDGKFELGAGFFPNIHPDDQGGVSIGGGSLWALDSKDDAKKAASWEFIKYMISPDQQAYWNAMTGYFPITVETHETQAFQENLAQYPLFSIAIDQLHGTKPEYAGSLMAVFPEARLKTEEVTERVILGEWTPEQALTELVKQINEAIEIYNLTND